jgi:hypothetical protein
MSGCETDAGAVIRKEIRLWSVEGGAWWNNTYAAPVMTATAFGWMTADGFGIALDCTGY